MPTQVEVLGHGIVEFPDSMGEAEIREVLQRKFSVEPAVKAAVEGGVGAAKAVTDVITNPAAGMASQGAREAAQAERDQNTANAVSFGVNAGIEATQAALNVVTNPLAAEASEGARTEAAIQRVKNLKLDASQMLVDPATGIKRESGMEPGTEFTKAMFVDLPADVYNKVLHPAGATIGDFLKAYTFEAARYSEPFVPGAWMESAKAQVDPGKEWAAGAESLPTVPRVAAETASGLVESTPQLAIGAIDPALGALAFGLNPNGYDPVTGMAMLALPGVSAASGNFAKVIAGRLGVQSRTALGILQAAGGASGAAALIGADQARIISALPKEERQQAFEGAIGASVAAWAMGMAHAGMKLDEAKSSSGTSKPGTTDTKNATERVIREARKNGFGPEFKAFFSGKDPSVFGTTPEKVQQWAKSNGLLYDPASVRTNGKIPEDRQLAAAAESLTQANAPATAAVIKAQAATEPVAPAPLTPEQVKVKGIKERIAAGIDPQHLVATVSPDQIDPATGKAIPGTGYAQIDEKHPTLGDTFSSNPEQLSSLGLEVPDRAKLMRLPPGQHLAANVDKILAVPPEIMAKGMKDEAKDHPEVPKHLLSTIVAQEYALDPHAYDEKPKAPAPLTPEEIAAEEAALKESGMNADDEPEAPSATTTESGTTPREKNPNDLLPSSVRVRGSTNSDGGYQSPKMTPEEMEEFTQTMVSNGYEPSFVSIEYPDGTVSRAFKKKAAKTQPSAPAATPAPSAPAPSAKPQIVAGKLAAMTDDDLTAMLDEADGTASEKPKAPKTIVDDLDRTKPSRVTRLRGMISDVLRRKERISDLPNEVFHSANYSDVMDHLDDTHAKLVAELKKAEAEEVQRRIAEAKQRLELAKQPKATGTKETYTPDALPSESPDEAAISRTTLNRGASRPAETTAGESFADAGKKAKAAAAEAWKGLGELFGGAGMGSGTPIFNEKTYAKAKPHFKAAYEEAKASGGSMLDFIKKCIAQFGKAVRPYLERFAKEMREIEKRVQGAITQAESRLLEAWGKTTEAFDRLAKLQSEATKHGVTDEQYLLELNNQLEKAGVDKVNLTNESETANENQLASGSGEAGSAGTKPVRPDSSTTPEKPESTAIPGTAQPGATQAVSPGSPGGSEAGVGGTGSAGTGPESVPGAGAQRPTGELQSGAADQSGGSASGSGELGVSGSGVDERPGEATGKPGSKSAANAGNHVITDLDEFERGGAKSKFRDNINAIQTVRKVLAEGRPATPEEQAILARYVGWGRSEFSQGLFGRAYDWEPESEASKWSAERQELINLIGEEEFDSARRSTLNAHYTTPRLADANWRMLKRLGFAGGKINEPGMGVGIFYGTMPADISKRSSLVGVEMDLLTASIAKLLYPGAKIHNLPYQETSLPDDWFDLHLSNVPFGDIAIRKDKYNKFNAPLHDYYFLKAVQNTRPGGLISFITSTGTLDKGNVLWRKELAKHADLIASFRLPDGAFQKGAGTAVVTDLMILRRRMPDEKPSDIKWTDLKTLPDPEGGEPIAINEYYSDHPENILGTLDRKSRQYGKGESHVSKTDDFEARVEKAILSLPEGVYTKAASTKIPAPEQIVEANSKTKNFGYEFKDGKLWQRVDGKLVGQSVGPENLKAAKALLELRDQATNLINAECLNSDDAIPDAERAKLKAMYDAFCDKYTSVHSVKSTKLMADDPDWPLLLSLESVNEDTRQVSPADILSKRTNNARVVKERAESMPEAVGISLNEFGSLNSERIGKLLGITPDEAEETIVRNGLGFRLPGGGVELSDNYLSGNVREKLIQAQAAADLDPRFTPNVEALQKVIPDDLPYSEIDVRLGSPWIPTEDYQAFMGELLGVNPDFLQVSLIQQSGKWVVEHKTDRTKKILWSNAAFNELYGTPRADFLAITRAAMDDKPIAIYDTGPDDTRVFNAEASAAANLKVDQVREAFKEWVWKDDERRNRLSRFYNDNFNNIVQPKHDGSWIEFPDLNLAAYPNGPYSHQLSSVARMIAMRRLFLGHEVGTGKTLTYALLARKAKQLGYANKPALVVLNANIEQITEEVQRAFPTMRILSTSGQFEAANRQKTIARIATGDWDLVVMTHDNFNMLDVDKEVEAKFINEEIEELTQAIRAREASEEGVKSNKKKDLTTKQLEKMKERLLEKLHEALGRKRDPAISFQRLGIDALMIDECQAYKSLPVYTARGSVKGIPQSRSNRATNMQMHVRWLQENNPKTVVAFGSGTPIDNSMVELYNWQRLLQPEELAKRGIGAFDAWANTFGQTVTSVEPTAAGEFKPTTRFKRFTNVPELSNLFRMMMDVRFASDMPHIKRPQKNESVVAVPMSDIQAEFMESLAARSKNLRRSTMKEDNMLLICTDGRKCAIHPGLVSADWVSEPGGKVDECVSNVLKYHKAEPGVTQMIFSDLGVNPTDWGFHLYRHIIGKLVAGGIPKDKIIDFSKLKEGEERIAAIRRLRNGDALVGIGGTAKMGTGVNAQKNLKYLHHLDAPMTPGRITQRDGRAWRQGNTHPSIGVIRYVTKGSLDAFMWSLIDNKSTFIGQLLRGGLKMREVEETDTEGTGELSPARVMAEATGNPDVINAVELQTKVQKLEMQRRIFEQEKSRRLMIADKYEVDLQRAHKVYEEAKKDALLSEQVTAQTPVEIGGKSFAELDETLSKAVDEAMTKAGDRSEESIQVNGPGKEWHPIGKIGPFEIGAKFYHGTTEFSWQKAGAQPRWLIRGNDDHPISVSEDPLTLIRSAKYVIQRMPEWRQKMLNEIGAIEANIKKISGQHQGAWPHGEELQASKQELGQIMARLQAKKTGGKETKSDLELKIAQAEERVADELGDASLKAIQKNRDTAKMPPEQYLDTLNQAIDSGKVPDTTLNPPDDEDGGDEGQIEYRHSGIPIPGMDEFIKNDVAPLLKKGVNAAKAGRDLIIDILSPTTNAKPKDVDAMFESKGYKEKLMTKAIGALDGMKRSFDRMPQAEQVAFIDRMKRGIPQPSAELQHAADLLREWDDRVFNEAKNYKPSLPYLDNHMRVLWKVIPGSPEALALLAGTPTAGTSPGGITKPGIVGKRPWRGSMGFTKQHVLADMSEGLALGGVPVTYNPIEMFVLHTQDVMKFVAANMSWESLKATGSVVWVKNGGKVPEGFVQISDRIAKPFFRKDWALAKSGEFYVEEGAARMINNYLSRDYIRSGKFRPIGMGLLWFKNATTAVELGLSPFHAVFESFETVSSSLGLGVTKLASGQVTAGLLDIRGALYSPRTTAKLGGMVKRYAENPQQFQAQYPEAYRWFMAHYPRAEAMIHDLFAGGGMVNMHDDYRVSGQVGFQRALAEGNYPGAILRAIPALNAQAMKPLFEKYIPRLKLGLFFREYAFELECNAAALASGALTREALARKTWAFIDDRFGELNWDNLYWDRTFKSAMQLVFRSVTWKMGNIRGFGKAIGDTAAAAKAAGSGKRPQFTIPMGWLLGMAVVTSVVSSIISRVATGKYPWELASNASDLIKNLTFPRIDANDQTQRVSVPTYLRDAVHLLHSVPSYIKSSMTGEWGRIADVWTNKDFYGEQVHNPNDPYFKQAKDSFLHLIPLPFGASSWVASRHSGESIEKSLSGFVGFTKAPGYISPSATSEMFDMAHDWMSQSKDLKIRETARRRLMQRDSRVPSEYQPLHSALKSAENLEPAREEYQKLLQVKKPEQVEKEMRRWRDVLFTGNHDTESRFKAKLTPAQNAVYEAAKLERQTLFNRFQVMKSGGGSAKASDNQGATEAATEMPAFEP